jgi:hypothetical protein
MSAPCAGYSPFHIKTMQHLCRTCPAATKAACLQSAADAPFPMLEAQVWGGLVLPAQRDRLPAPTRQAAYAPEPRVHAVTSTNRNGSGRPPWWLHLGRALDPDHI